MKELNERIVNAITNEVNVCMEAIANKYGVTYERNDGKWDGLEFRISSVKFVVKSEISNKANAKEANDFGIFSTMYGIIPDALGETFRCADGTFKIIGWLRRSKKYNIIAENVSNNKIYKFSASIVKMHLPSRLLT